MDHLIVALIVTLLVFGPVFLFMKSKLGTLDRSIKEKSALLLSTAREHSRNGDWTAASALYKDVILLNIGESEVLQQLVSELSVLYREHSVTPDLSKVCEFGARYDQCFEGLPEGCSQNAEKVQAQLKEFLAGFP
jgi:hypothetical protein